MVEQMAKRADGGLEGAVVDGVLPPALGRQLRPLASEAHEVGGGVGKLQAVG